MILHHSTSSVDQTLSHLVSVLTPVAKSLNFTLSALDGSAKSSPSHITMYVTNTSPLEPAPITPAEDPSFALMAGTCKHIFGEDTIVAPTGMFGKSTGLLSSGVAES